MEEKTLWLALLAGAAALLLLAKYLLARAEVSRLQTELDQLRVKATHDALTGLLQRDEFFEQMKHARLKRDEGALLLIDADYFKKINDTYGHQTGDIALMKIAEAIARQVRDEDVVGRIGGEEFCIFIPEAGRAEAEAVAERIRRSVSALRFRPIPARLHRLTVSIGVACSHHALSRSQMMRLADNALYEAKASGRDRVCTKDGEIDVEREVAVAAVA